MLERKLLVGHFRSIARDHNDPGALSNLLKPDGPSLRCVVVKSRTLPRVGIFEVVVCGVKLRHS